MFISEESFLSEKQLILSADNLYLFDIDKISNKKISVYKKIRESYSLEEFIKKFC